MPATKQGELLNARQQAFVKHYMSNGYRPGAAALSAGYGANNADITAQKLLDNPKVKAEIEAQKSKRFRRYDVTADRVVRELALLGFSNMQDYMTVQKDGSAVMDLTGLTRNQAAAIQQLDSEVYLDGKGEDAREVKKCRVRLHEKRGALELLGKHLGIFDSDKQIRSIEVRVLLDGNKAGVAVGVKE